MIKRKPYLAIGIAILKKDGRGNLDLVYMREFATERQVELEV